MWRRILIVAAVAVTALVPGLTAVPAAAHADVSAAKVVPIRVTGDPGKRFNLVVMGDGYTQADMPKFREHLDKHLNVLLTVEPFKSYRNYLNIYAVEIPSEDSGVSCDPDLTSPRKNTPLHMGFWGNCDASSVRRALTVDDTAAVQYANLVPGTTSGNRQILAIANSDTYGGTGGTYATASGGNAMSSLITPHELGHSLGGLQDEYDYYSRGVQGGAYTDGEPSSIHHTLLTEQQMTSQHKKWWRWLGEPSESGGVIGRYESGMYSSSGIWRPSAHSIMKTLGYYYDQVSREQMTQRISGKTNILQDGTPTGKPIGADRVVWVETLHPNSHQIDVRWTVDGAKVPTGGSRSLDLRTLGLKPGKHTLVATVVDPTDFVRDPAIRASSALTRTRTWTVDTSATTPPVSTPVDFTSSTATDRPVGAHDVIYAETTRPTDRILTVSWAVDGSPVATTGNDRDLDLNTLKLTTGRHTLTATVGSHTRTWTIDATDPVAKYELSGALLTVNMPGKPAEYIYNGPFSMRLTATDDTPGYDVREFRTDGDGWFNYFGWPTDANAPWKFTADGTEIDGLVYGKLGTPRLSPWDKVPPNYGRHTIEYRATDPAGNIGPANSFVVTLMPQSPACTTTVTGRHNGPLVISSGVTCLDRAEVTGPITVRPGASLVATGASISGPVTASDASAVQLLNSTVRGPVTLNGASDGVTMVGGRIDGPVVLSGNHAAVVAGVTVAGPLVCAGNASAPQNLNAPDTVYGPTSGQCTGLGAR